MSDPCGHLRAGHAAICRGERDDLPHEKRVAYLLRWRAEGKIGDDALFAAGIDPENPPSITQRAVTFGRAMGRVAAAVASGKPVMVTADVLAARKAVCVSCDKSDAGWCRKCGCALAAKQRIATESCPLGRWPESS